MIEIFTYYFIIIPHQSSGISNLHWFLNKTILKLTLMLHMSISRLHTYYINLLSYRMIASRGHNNCQNKKKVNFSKGIHLKINVGQFFEFLGF